MRHGIETLKVCVVFLVVASVTQAFAAEQVFTASYLRIVNGVDYYGSDVDLVVEHATISGDGSRVVFSGRNSSTNERTIFLVDADGSNLSGFVLPANPDDASEQIRVSHLAITRDGSRVFFVTPWYQNRIYKLESGAITEILNMDDYSGITPNVSDPLVRTTWDGEYAYFHEDRDDIWRVHHSGGAPEMVVDDHLVLRNGGYAGWAVGSFDIADDGDPVAFVLFGYSTPSQKGTVVSYDLFAKASSQDCTVNDQCQLTLDSASESNPAISGNGTMIVYENGTRWCSIRPDGAAWTELEPRGYNIGGNSLTYNGDLMFYYDSEARGGRLSVTDGSGGLDLFPVWNVANITIRATWDPVISDDGSAMCFRHDTNSVYAGKLNSAAPVVDAPVIHDITFDPPYMADDDPGATVVLTSQISDPQGLATITDTSTDALIDGSLERDFADLPAYFQYAAHDDGVAPDQVAADGIYSTNGQPGGAVDTLPGVRIRMAATDETRHVTVSDAWLPVCSNPQCALFSDGFESGNTTAWSATAP